jgi:hypothetical protein
MVMHGTRSGCAAGASDPGEDRGGEDMSFALIFVLVVIFMLVIIPGIPWLFYRFILDVEEDYGICWLTGFGITCVALMCILISMLIYTVINTR